VEEPAEVADDLSTVLADVVEETTKGMVGIRTYVDGVANSTGSGVVYKIEGNTHYVVTNNHVASGGDDLNIFFHRNGNIFEVEEVTVVGSDLETDVALITFEWEQENDFDAVPFADSYETRRGEIVIAIGSPLNEGYFGTSTLGMVSYKSRFISDDALGVSAFFIQHDAAISPGNSGGALFNTNGELLGINTLKIVREEVEGMGFSVPSNTLNRVLEDLEEFGYVERPFLGISSLVGALDCEGEYGVCVNEVVENSSAEAIGLQVDDLIIGFKKESWDEYIDIYNFFDLREAILNSCVGDSVSLIIIRNGETIFTEYEPLIDQSE
jgi:serine protease Do